MTDITKAVDRGIPTELRTQFFTQADASTGDFILVEESLGRRAHTVSVEATGGTLQIRLNPRVTVDKPRYMNAPDSIFGYDHLPDLSSRGTVNVTTVATITIEDGTQYKFSTGEGDPEVSIIEIVGGTYTAFDIYVS